MCHSAQPKQLNLKREIIQGRTSGWTTASFCVLHGCRSTRSRNRKLVYVLPKENLYAHLDFFSSHYKACSSFRGNILKAVTCPGQAMWRGEVGSASRGEVGLRPHLPLRGLGSGRVVGACRAHGGHSWDSSPPGKTAGSSVTCQSLEQRCQLPRAK